MEELRDRNSRQFLRKLQGAVSNGDLSLVKAELSAYGSNKVRDDINESYRGKTSFQIAIDSCNSDPSIITTLIDSGVNLNQVVKDGTTPLIYACQNGKPRFVELLIQKGADVNLPNDKGFTALMASVEAGDNGLVKTLISHGACVNFSDGRDITAMHIAVGKQKSTIVETLARAGCNVNHKNKERMTPLMMAASSGHLDIIQTLILAGCDFEHTDFDGNTALMLAVKNSHSSCVRLLLQSGADPLCRNSKRVTPLLLAVSRLDEKIVELILGHSRGKLSIDYADHENTTPLFQATKSAVLYGLLWSDSTAGHILSAILKAGCDVNIAQSAMNWTPLFVAVYAGNNVITRKLLECKADANVRDKSGDSLLHAALITSRASLVRLLLDSGCDARACNNNNESVLFAAAFRGCEIQILDMIIAAGVDKNMADKTNKLSPLHVAVVNNYEEVTLSLIERGCDINMVDIEGTTVLTKAILRGQKAVVDKLLSMPNCKINLGTKLIPLHAAVLRTDEGIISKLLAKGADINKTDNSGMRPIQLAVENNQRRIMRALMSAGCTLDATEGSQLLVPKSCCRTYHDAHPHMELQPLYAAVKYDDLDMFSLLLSYYHKQPISLLQTLHDMLTIAYDTGSLTSRMISPESRKAFLHVLRQQLHAPWTLLDLCRGEIRRTLGVNVVEKIKLLSLPITLKHYLLYDRDRSLDLSDINSPDDLD